MLQPRTATLALGFAIALGACESDVLTVEQQYTAPTLVFEVPASAYGTAPVDVVRSGVDLGLEAALADFGIAEGALESATVASVSGRLVAPGDSLIADQLTFDHLTRGELWLAADAVDPALIAELPRDAEGSMTDLELAEPALQQFLRGENATAIFRLGLDEAPAPGTTVELDVTYRVVGGV